MITAEDITKAVEEHKDKIIKDLVQGLKDDCKTSLGWAIKEEIQKAVADSFREELSEEVRNMVKDNKEVVLAEMQTAFVKILAEIGNACVVAATKKMDSSWERGKILKAIFE